LVPGKKKGVVTSLILTHEVKLSKRGGKKWVRRTSINLEKSIVPLLRIFSLIRETQQKKVQKNLECGGRGMTLGAYLGYWGIRGGQGI